MSEQEYKLTVLCKEILFVKGNSITEATEKAKNMLNVHTVLSCDIYNPGKPCEICNPAGSFRFGTMGESCVCKGKGFV